MRGAVAEGKIRRRLRLYQKGKNLKKSKLSKPKTKLTFQIFVFSFSMFDKSRLNKKGTVDTLGLF